METNTLTTPSGYIVTFKPVITFGDKRQIQRVFMASAKVNPSKPEDIDFSVDVMFDAQDTALKLLVTDVQIPGAAPMSDPQEILTTINGWPEADGQAVYDRLDQLTQDVDAKDRKKKNP